MLFAIFKLRDFQCQARLHFYLLHFSSKTTFYSINLAIALIKEVRTRRDTIRVQDSTNNRNPIGFRKIDRGKHRSSVYIPLYGLKVVIKKGKYLCSAYPTYMY